MCKCPAYFIFLAKCWTDRLPLYQSNSIIGFDTTFGYNGLNIQKLLRFIGKIKILSLQLTLSSIPDNTSFMHIYLHTSMFWLGTPVCTNIDEFLEKFQTALPLFFGKNVAIFFYKIFWNGNDPPKLASLMLKILQQNFLDRKWPPLPPLELFQKFIDNGTDRRP